MKEHPKKELAYLLFVNQGLDLKAISGLTGISQNTLSAWNKAGDWKKLQVLRKVAPEQLTARYLEHQARIMDVADKAKRALTIPEVDALAKLSKSAANNDKTVNEAIVMSVLKGFSNYLALIDPLMAKTLTDYHLSYVSSLLDARK